MTTPRHLQIGNKSWWIERDQSNIEITTILSQDNMISRGLFLRSLDFKPEDIHLDLFVHYIDYAVLFYVGKNGIIYMHSFNGIDVYQQKDIETDLIHDIPLIASQHNIVLNTVDNELLVLEGYKLIKIKIFDEGNYKLTETNIFDEKQYGTHISQLNHLPQPKKIVICPIERSNDINRVKFHCLYQKDRVLWTSTFSTVIDLRRFSIIELSNCLLLSYEVLLISCFDEKGSHLMKVNLLSGHQEEIKFYKECAINSFAVDVDKQYLYIICFNELWLFDLYSEENFLLGNCFELNIKQKDHKGYFTFITLDPQGVPYVLVKFIPISKNEIDAIDEVNYKVYKLYSTNKSTAILNYQVATHFVRTTTTNLIIREYYGNINFNRELSTICSVRCPLLPLFIEYQIEKQELLIKRKK